MMRTRITAVGVACLVCALCLPAAAKTLTYNQLDTINLRDRGMASDERTTNALLVDGGTVYGATSGDVCHIFRFDPATGAVDILATLPGPNTVMKGLVKHGDDLYVATMRSERQRWLDARKTDPDYDIQDINLLPVSPEENTGHLYKVSTTAGTGQAEDLGVLIEGQGIHTMAVDAGRGLIYGITAPKGRFFVYTIATGQTEHTSFGKTFTNLSNHMVAVAEVERELAELIPGEGEWNNRLIPKAMHVRTDGTLYTSGWQGRILKYDPNVENIQDRFSIVGWIPSAPGRQYWNRIDAIVEHEGKLIMGTSDGYIIRLDPATNEIDNFGKPIRAIDVMGLAVSPLDGKLYGLSGGGLEGMCRFWACDLSKGTFEVDYPALNVIRNRRPAGALVATDSGALVISEAWRVANLHVLMPGEAQDWVKSGILDEFNPQEGRHKKSEDGRFEGRKQLEVEYYPMPSAMHGGSGYTAIQADNDGKVYVGTAYYGKRAELIQLTPATAQWRSLLRSDWFTHQFGRGQGIPGKIHTKLRLGDDGRIYGAMKQGYELHYGIRADVGEAPEGVRGSQFTCHIFAYDPATDQMEDLGPGWPQEGITAFAVDTNRGYVYSGSVPGVYFLVTDIKTKRTWNAGQMQYTHPSRYMPRDPGTGRVYHPGESTPEGRNFLTVWDPDQFRLRDVEVIGDEELPYRHSYASVCGPAGTNTLYGRAGESLYEMNLDDSTDGKFHAKPVCYIGVDGDDKNSGMYAIARGFDDRIYWVSNGGRNLPLDLFSWDPKTKTKRYLGSCAVGGDFIRGGHCQGMALDRDGNLSLHILYSEITEEQKQHWRVAEDFFYEDVPHQDHYLGYPAHLKNTYYAVYRIPNAGGIE